MNTYSVDGHTVKAVDMRAAARIAAGRIAAEKYGPAGVVSRMHPLVADVRDGEATYHVFIGRPVVGVDSVTIGEEVIVRVSACQ